LVIVALDRSAERANTGGLLLVGDAPSRPCRTGIRINLEAIPVSGEIADLGYPLRGPFTERRSTTAAKAVHRRALARVTPGRPRLANFQARAPGDCVTPIIGKSHGRHHLHHLLSLWRSCADF
jgi:hypothetical protein